MNTSPSSSPRSHASSPDAANLDAANPDASRPDASRPDAPRPEFGVVPEPGGRAAPHQERPQVDATRRAGTPAARALVLGGGGSTGNAWLIGVLAGLVEAGLDVTHPDLTVGTSAGSTAAIQIAGATMSDLLALTSASAAPQRSVPPAAGRGGAPGRPVTDHLQATRELIASSADAAEMRRRMGAAALAREAASDGSWPSQWRATVAGRLPSQQWPERAVLITAVDAETGAPVAFDRHSGVDLADAVAASCSSMLPYRINGTAYIDGGYRRNENADLASGCARVLVLSPFGGATLHPLEWGMQLSAQVDELRAQGSRVETIYPDAAAEHLFGANAMNPALRPAAAQAGHDQGTKLAGPLAEFWG